MTVHHNILKLKKKTESPYFLFRSAGVCKKIKLGDGAWKFHFFHWEFVFSTPFH